MVKANELRVGNLLKYQTAEGDVVIDTIDWQDLKWISEDLKGFNLVHSPISLTEEWLIKFGFEKIKKESYSTGKKVDFNVFILGQFSYNSIQENWWYCNFILENPPKYVHQLQNLYFALTGEELTIKN